MKNAIVTGGTKGIGLAIAEMLLHEHYFVTITYGSDVTSADNCRKHLSAFSSDFEVVQVDQSDKQAVHAFAANMTSKGHIDCIVLNAGTTFRGSLQDTSDDTWEHVMQVNVNSPTYLLRDLKPTIPNNSRIIFIGSLMGILPHSVSLAYGVSKAAVIALAKNLVKEFEGTGTTINVIAPGFVDTSWQKNKPAAIRESICNKTAIHRFAQPAEIADAVRFCIGNAFVNGAVLEVTGGYNYK